MALVIDGLVRALGAYCENFPSRLSLRIEVCASIQAPGKSRRVRSGMAVTQTFFPAGHRRSSDAEPLSPSGWAA